MKDFFAYFGFLHLVVDVVAVAFVCWFLRHSKTEANRLASHDSK